MSDEKVEVGSTVWVLDENHRVYDRDENGRAKGGPIWLKSWMPRKVVGENRASWLLDRGDKFPKKNGRYTAGRGGYGGHRVALSWDAVMEAEWVRLHRYGIERMVGSCNDPTTLRQIAALVGYKESPDA